MRLYFAAVALGASVLAFAPGGAAALTIAAHLSTAGAAWLAYLYW
jgi:hypothetical protein